MIKDIVCGMYLISTDGCKESVVNGKKYYFCCDVCKEEFDKNTGRYDVSIQRDISEKEPSLFIQTIERERDLVCGELINVHEAAGISIYKNSTYYFCCQTCKKVFDKNPSAYADKEERYYDPDNPNDFHNGIFRIL
ncbi:MAG: YHS domain-containing protein [Ignavibacteriaceae bacterium]